MKKLKILFGFAILLIAVMAISFVSREAGLSLAMAGLMVPRDRALFKHLHKKFGTVPSPSYLRIEQALSNSKGVYEFRFNRTDNEAITEEKLDRNDVFVITHLAVYIIAQNSQSVGSEVCQTFVNQQVFANADGFTPAHLETIYNGNLQLKVGNKVNIENLSMQEFRVVPSTQQSAATNLSESSADAAKYAPDSLIYIQGNKDNTVKIDIPTFSGMEIAAVATNTTNKLVFHPYGYLLKGAANRP